PISGTDFLGTVPGVSTYSLGARIEQLIVPATGAYSITFRTADEPLALAVTLGTNITTTRAVRYQDLSLPAGVTATLTLTPQGPSALRYDANGDGNFETTVSPTVSVSGPQANDVVPPEITVGTTNIHSPTLRVSLTAQDSGSGVQRLLYSLDGTHFQPYTGPFQANMVATPTLYAF